MLRGTVPTAPPVFAAQHQHSAPYSQRPTPIYLELSPATAVTPASTFLSCKHRIQSLLLSVPLSSHLYSTCDLYHHLSLYTSPRCSLPSYQIQYTIPSHVRCLPPVHSPPPTSNLRPQYTVPTHPSLSPPVQSHELLNSDLLTES